MLYGCHGCCVVILTLMNDGTKSSLLLIEDHEDLSMTIGRYLEQKGLVLDYAYDGAMGLGLAASNDYNLIILDLQLPKVDGIEVCKILRQQGKTVPILMLTARDSLDDKLEGFDSGADDYLIKPFEMKELLARVTALIRRSEGQFAKHVLLVGDLSLDLSTMEARRGNQLLDLSPTCLKILKVLMQESPRLVSRERLEHELWGDSLPDSDALRSHLYNLRKIVDRPFEHKLLKTVQGLGLKIVE